LTQRTILSAIKLHTHSKTPASFPGLVEFFLLLLLPLWCLVDFRNLGYTVSLLLALFTALFLVRFLKIPAPELIVQATEAKAKAENLTAERAKELQVLQEENGRLRNEIKDLQEYKEKAHRELCRVRDEQKTIGKIKVNTEL
jgi:cell division protein FtsB